VLFVGAGPGAFIGLVAVFILAWASTRVGYRRKQEQGTAEGKAGRKASQVLANLSVAAGCAVLRFAHSRVIVSGVIASILGASDAVASSLEIFSLGMVAAFAEAAADTVSSELGQIQRRARLITTWRMVPPGTDGGVSPLGTLAGVFSAALVAGTCFLVRLVPSRGAVIAIVAATIGMLADSLLGALFERRGVLNNDAVNFLGTLIAAGVAIFYASFCG
ncbi:MAG: DUF92 domain-containing protein, partial [Candidatus Angelobacter sp.]